MDFKHYIKLVIPSINSLSVRLELTHSTLAKSINFKVLFKSLVFFLSPLGVLVLLSFLSLYYPLYIDPWLSHIKLDSPSYTMSRLDDLKINPLYISKASFNFFNFFIKASITFF